MTYKFDPEAPMADPGPGYRFVTEASETQGRVWMTLEKDIGFGYVCEWEAVRGQNIQSMLIFDTELEAKLALTPEMQALGFKLQTQRGYERWYLISLQTNEYTFKETAHKLWWAEIGHKEASQKRKQETEEQYSPYIGVFPPKRLESS